MDKKIIKNSDKKIEIAGTLYADHDISLPQYKHIVGEELHDRITLLQGDKKYDRKKR